MEDGTSGGIKVLIVGAGLAGLAAALSTKLANAAHEVVVFEAARELQEIGAGLQITPNATKLLSKWNILEALRPLATEPQSLTVRRYDDTQILARQENLQATMAERYGSPFWGVHRVDLQRALATRCKGLGVEIRLSSRVVDVSFDTGEIEMNGRGRERGDVVICAEGLWSATRPRFLGRVSEPVPTGDMTYRIAVDTTKLPGPHGDEIREFAREGGVNFWIGPDSHAVSYSVRGGDFLGFGILRPDDLAPEMVKTTAPHEEVAALLSDWDPLLQRILAGAGTVLKWKLLYVEALPEWSSPSGTFFIVGDACHPMLPYLAQGANSALEDGAALGVLLGKVSSKNKATQLKKVAAMYQSLRRDRGAEIQKESFAQREAFHLPDGEAQIVRDAVMLAALGGEPGGVSVEVDVSACSGVFVRV